MGAEEIPAGGLRLRLGTVAWHDVTSVPVDAEIKDHRRRFQIWARRATLLLASGVDLKTVSAILGESHAITAHVCGVSIDPCGCGCRYACFAPAPREHCRDTATAG